MCNLLSQSCHHSQKVVILKHLIVIRNNIGQQNIDLISLLLARLCVCRPKGIISTNSEEPRVKLHVDAFPFAVRDVERMEEPTYFEALHLYQLTISGIVIHPSQLIFKKCGSTRSFGQVFHLVRV